MTSLQQHIAEPKTKRRSPKWTPGPPKMLRPNIWRHDIPPVDTVDLDGVEAVFHTISESFSGPVHGELVRWIAADGEVGYEVNINGLEDPDVADVSAYSIEATGNLACVANDLRYEWEMFTGVHGWNRWTYYFGSRYPGASYPNA